MGSVPTVETDYGTETFTETTGLAAIPVELSREAAKEPFVLNILAIGRRGSGIATLINTLFGAPLVDHNRPDELTTTVNEIEEACVTLRVTVSTYHGADLAPALVHVREAHREYYEQEQGLSHGHRDCRIHACLFAVSHGGLNETEAAGLAAISRLCNVIPVITRADACMAEEIEALRTRVRAQLKQHGVEAFDFNEAPGVHVTGGDSGDGGAQEGGEVLPTAYPQWPLATVASEQTYEINGRIACGRRYPWGFIDIANESHSDFKRLQRLMLQSGYDELLWRTDTHFYNTIRKEFAARFSPVPTTRRLAQLQAEIERILDMKHAMALEELQREEAALDNFIAPNDGAPSAPSVETGGDAAAAGEAAGSGPKTLAPPVVATSTVADQAQVGAMSLPASEKSPGAVDETPAPCADGAGADDAYPLITPGTASPARESPRASPYLSPSTASPVASVRPLRQTIASFRAAAVIRQRERLRGESNSEAAPEGPQSPEKALQDSPSAVPQNSPPGSTQGSPQHTAQGSPHSSTQGSPKRGGRK